MFGYSNDISNSYNLGNLQYRGVGKVKYMGGIIGSLGNRTIEKCYNIANVDNEKSYWFGGIAGDTFGNINSCYYLEGSAMGGVEGNDIEGQAMPLEESKMPSVISVLMTDNDKVEWNGEMVDVWKEDTNNINNGYPILFWQ